MQGHRIAAFLFALGAAAPAFSQEIVRITASRTILPRVEAASAATLGTDTSFVVQPAAEDEELLDLLEGRVAAVAIDAPLMQAVADARVAAFAHGRLLSVPSTLAFHEVGRDPGTGRAYGLVTLGLPSAQAARVLELLWSARRRGI
jgi:hypothetical protein